MANQNGWTDERRDAGGYEDAVRRAQRRPDRGDDYGARYEDPQSGGDGSFDLRDDYRYGAGQGSDYAYGRGAQGRSRPYAERGAYGDYNTGGYPQSGAAYSYGYGRSDNDRYGGGAYPARISGYSAGRSYGTGAYDPRYGSGGTSARGEPRSFIVVRRRRSGDPPPRR
jgi:hypothetical protein